MTVLRGPNEADNFRTKVGRYGDRWYTDPLPECDLATASDEVWPSISTVKKANSNDWSYVAMKRCATDLAKHPTKYDGEPEANYEQMKVANKVGLSVDGGRGTIIHLWCEDLLNGQPMRTFTDLDLMSRKLPKEALEIALRYQPAVQAFFDAYQPELVAAEVVCINRTLNGVGYGGTGDAIVRINQKVYKVDWKSRGESSDHGAYPEEGAQVAALAGGEYMIVAGTDGDAVRVPIPKMDGGLIVSIKSDGCRVYPIDLAKGFEYWSDLHAWWCARRTERDAVGRSWAPKAAPTEDLSGLLEESISLTRPSLVRRVKAIVAAGHAERLSIVWPADVPGFATDRDHTTDERALILAAVRQVENETSMPFDGDDAPTPVTSTPAEPVEPPADDPDGPLVSDAHRDALNARYAALDEDEQATVLKYLPAYYQVTPLGTPRQRIWSIARALILWMEAGWDYEIICDLIDEVTGQTRPLDLVIPELTIDQADRLTEQAKQVLNGTHTATHDGHWTLTAA